MITGLLGWFAGKKNNERKYPRIRKPYRASMLVEGGGERAAVGVDISAGGISILTRERIEATELDMLLKLEDELIRVRVRVAREQPHTHDGARLYRYGMQYIGIAADDWDAVVRFTTDRPVSEQQSILPPQLDRVRMSPDDAARLLPLTLQNRLLAMLVQRRRLAPLDERQNPLVQYFYSGVVRKERLLLHHLTIQSKIVQPDGTPMLFETEFLFDDVGGNVEIVGGGPVEAKPAANR